MINFTIKIINCNHVFYDTIININKKKKQYQKGSNMMCGWNGEICCMI